MQSSGTRRSAFWDELGQHNVHMLAAEGMENFKRTVANNYFNWLVTDVSHPNFQHAFTQWLQEPDVSALFATIGDTDHLRRRQRQDVLTLTAHERDVYRLYVGLLWSCMRHHDDLNLHTALQEPEIGNPIRIEQGGKLISQDLANSIIECNTIAKLLDGVERPRILELGAGYGRLAHVYTASQQGQYFIFDIEPALDVAHWYLSKIFGDGACLIDDVREAGDAKIALVHADSIENVPDGFFDLALSISTLPELTEELAAFYLKQFQRVSRGHVFLKQWNAWRNPRDGALLKRESYSLRPEWAVILERDDPLVPNFFIKAWRYNR